MTKMTKKPEKLAKQRGRPMEKTMPEPIPDTPENVAGALLSTPPKGEDGWDYLKDRDIEVARVRLQRVARKTKRVK